MKVNDKIVAKIEAGVNMVKWAKSGKSKAFMWEELGRMGFSERERVDIAETVNGFMLHKKGDHSKCPPMCGQVESLAKEFDGMEREPSVQECADAIERRHKLHDSNTFSDDIKEEWK